MSLIEKTKDIVKHFKFKFNKSFGQNFLIDEDILEKTIEAMDLNPESTVIEIGPGIGTLTHEIAKKAGRVYSIEIDETLIPILEETLGNYNNVSIIKGDALKVDFKKLIDEYEMKNVKIAANLPYYITTPVVTKIFTENPGAESITLMIQKEAADRITAKPNTDEYGHISIISQYYSNITRICKVSPSSFMPQPKVESVVIRMDLKEPEYGVVDEKLFFRIVRDSFNMRRKTLWNVLKGVGLSPELLREAMEASGIEEKRRGETLSIEEFARLSNEIKARM